MSAKLTKKIIDRAVYEGDKHGTEWDVRWDSLIPGLCVRLYPSGRKAFILRYRAQGPKRLFTIRTYGPITLEQARAQAKQRIGEVVQGEDPVEQRRKER